MKLLMFQRYLYTKHIPALKHAAKLTYWRENQKLTGVLSRLINEIKDINVYNFR